MYLIELVRDDGDGSETAMLVALDVLPEGFREGTVEVRLLRPQ